MSLAIRLKQARQKKRLTQADLALAVGIKQQAIQRIEAGKVKSTSYIVQMAKVLDVSPEWLALGNEPTAETITTAEHPVTTSGTKSEVPLIEWSDLKLLAHAIQKATEMVPTMQRMGQHSFAVRAPDESMHGSDGHKTGFHRNDILLVDGSREPHNGDYTIVHHEGRYLFRQYVNDGSGAYLRALSTHHESISCDRHMKFLGVIVSRITVFP
ncbi:MAG: LexA family transcriptional regulator [Gammaproteobacteria bacterium]|nr:LexA family transcriptional regulator [Gammaproteobacteria bacterium]